MATYSVRMDLIPDGEQREMMTRQLAECRGLYNSLNNVCRTCLTRRMPVPRPDMLRAMAVGLSHGSDVDGSVLENVGDRVADAYRIYGDKVAKHGKSGLPRFKEAGRYRSMTFGPDAYRLGPDRMDLAGMGPMRTAGHRICREGSRGAEEPACRVSVDRDGIWHAGFVFDLEWLGGLESHADGEWERIDAETAVRILHTASGNTGRYLGRLGRCHELVQGARG